MKRSFIITLIALLVVGSAVGIGIHILHRDALAQTPFVINVVKWQNNQWVPTVFHQVQFQFNDGPPQNTFTDDNGKAVVVRDGEGWEWWEATWIQGVPADGDWIVWDGPNRNFWPGANPVNPSVTIWTFYVELLGE